MKKDDGLDVDCDIQNNLPAYLGSFILSNSKLNMNNFTREMNGFYNSKVFHTDTDSLYIERKYSDLLYKTKLIGG